MLEWTFLLPVSTTHNCWSNVAITIKTKKKLLNYCHSVLMYFSIQGGFCLLHDGSNEHNATQQVVLQQDVGSHLPAVEGDDVSSEPKAPVTCTIDSCIENRQSVTYHQRTPILSSPLPVLYYVLCSCWKTHHLFLWIDVMAAIKSLQKFILSHFKFCNEVWVWPGKLNLHNTQTRLPSWGMVDQDDLVYSQNHVIKIRM